MEHRMDQVNYFKALFKQNSTVGWTSFISLGHKRDVNLVWIFKNVIQKCSIILNNLASCEKEQALMYYKYLTIFGKSIFKNGSC